MNKDIKNRENEKAVKAEAGKKAKASNKITFANGSYALALCAIVIAAVVVLNFIVGALPSGLTTADVSTGKLYSIGDVTKEVLKNLDEDVTIHYLTASGSSNQTIELLLDQYKGASSRVTVKEVDLNEYPTYASEYTDESVSVNSVIVTAGDKSRYIASSDLMDYYEFDGEGQITSAISYVTSSTAKKVYYTTGHNEFPLSDEMQDAIEKSNAELSELNLLTGDVPDDCDMLIIFAPCSDFNAEEAERVSDYLERGGNLLMSTYVMVTDSPNLDSILEAYRVSRIDGVVCEQDSSYYAYFPYYLLPETAGSTVTSSASAVNILYAFAQGIEIADADDSDSSVSVLQVLKSSPSSYIKSLDGTDSEETASYPLAVEITKSYSTDSDGEADVDLEGDDTSSSDSENDSESAEAKETHILYFTSPAIFSEDAIYAMAQQNAISLPAGNEKLFASCVASLLAEEEAVAIEPKELSDPTITISGSAAGTIGRLLVIVLPIAAIAAGAFIYVRRRRR